MTDTLTVEVLDDGTIKVSTDDVSMPNHISAEGFEKYLSRLMGGEVKRVRKPLGHRHVHTEVKQGA